jgi:hypothetical protein
MIDIRQAFLFITAHFLLGFVVASLAFWLMRIMLSGIPGHGTYRFSLLVALFLSIVVHILEDYTLGWF